MDERGWEGGGMKASWGMVWRRSKGVIRQNCGAAPRPRRTCRVQSKRVNGRGRPELDAWQQQLLRQVL